MRVGDVAGYKKTDGYWSVQIGWNAIYLHRVIWEMHYGPIPEGYRIDHIDRDPDNNRIENLRLASRSENGCNQKRSSRNKSGYKNISCRGRGGSYTIWITKSGVRYYWTAQSLEAAISLRNMKLRELHGEFASYE